MPTSVLESQNPLVPRCEPLFHDHLPAFLASTLDSLTWVDLVLLGVLMISTLWGWARGMIREIFGLLAWAAAFWGARQGAPWLFAHLGAIHQQTLRWLLAFLGLMFVILIVVRMLGNLLRKLASGIGLGILDGLLGAAFGGLRGALIDVILLLLAGLTPLPQQPEWLHARFVPLALNGARQLLLWLPPDLARYVHF